MPLAPDPLAVVLAYHERTKHRPGRYARSLGYMDWATQPDPFRRFSGAPLVPLDLVPVGDEPRYEEAFVEGRVAPAAGGVDHRALSQLFQDALGLSAWKAAPGARWALRMNPSSGNLHPTEGYLVCGAIAGISEEPAVLHYAPREHALERRVTMSPAAWGEVSSLLPSGAVLVGLASVLWREAWKYGERAFRYCQHDVGHAIASVAVAAAGLGLRVRLLDGVADRDLARLLGVESQRGPEAEHPDCLLVVAPAAIDREAALGFTLPRPLLDELGAAAWSGALNKLSPDHHPWPEIDDVADASERPAGAAPLPAPFSLANTSLLIGDAPLRLRRVIHQRRSAVDFDGRSGITRDAFHQILLKALPGDGQVPFATLVEPPRIDLLLFVHRVAGMVPGLYALVRDPARVGSLRAALSPDFVWETPPECPASLPLFLLEKGDARAVAEQASCGQQIASAGTFAVAMIADYRAALAAGAWHYRRLHWEAGAIGQVLYLEAEATGIRGTGIGCFFDDVTHLTAGIRDDRFQVVYHFTLGGPVDDGRLQTLPPYAHLER